MVEYEIQRSKPNNFKDALKKASMETWIQFAGLGKCMLRISPEFAKMLYSLRDRFLEIFGDRTIATEAVLIFHKLANPSCVNPFKAMI